ncbi:MAG: HNH endonuclease [Alphaproteobacteria bacterium]|nr:HNH endonuclease [Alphaproteobacteria bacterium]
MDNWKVENLIEASTKSISIAQVLRFIKVDVSPANYRKFNKLAKRYNLNTSHFLGQSHCKGITKNLPKAPLEKILVVNSTFDYGYVKRRILKENLLPYKCSIPTCGINTWQNNHITLQLDHINGIKNDNRLENLRLICPNCHSQTNTYCGRNISKPQNMKKKHNNKCVDCSTAIYCYAIRCKSCEAKQRNSFVIDWPTIDDLISLVKKLGFIGAGKKLNVSDNSVRKHLRRNNIDPKSIKKDK